MRRVLDTLWAFCKVGRARLDGPEVMVRALHAELERLGGVYVKFLQHLVGLEMMNDYR